MDAAPTAVSERAPFRGWRIVAVAFFASAFAIGFTIIPYGLFTPAIGAEFGASLPTLMAGLGLLSVVMTAVGPVIGWMLDRYSIRAIMAGGATLLAASFALMSISTAVWQIGAITSVFVALGVAMLGPLPSTTVVSKWFDRRRGLAVGIASMGIPAGGLALAPLAGVLIDSLGWRTTLRVFALITLLIIPFIWLAVRNRPEDEGQVPDGSLATDGDEGAEIGPAWTTRAILRAPAFWILTLGTGIVFGLGGGYNANFPTFAADLGYTVAEAGVMLGIGAGLGLIGTPLAGYLADFLDNRALLFGASVAQAMAFVIYMTEPGYALLMAAVVLFGFTATSMMPVYAALLGRVFGPATFGQVMGMGGIVMLPFAAVAPSLVGWARETTGRYFEAFGALAVAFVVGGGILMLLRRPRET